MSTESNLEHRPRQTALLDDRWLKSKTKTELMDLLVEIALELKARMADDTDVGIQLPHEPPSFPVVDPASIQEFTRLPVDGDSPHAWRVVLVSSNLEHPPLGLDICGDVTIGRLTQGIAVDLDLTPYGAETLGVSREHAILRPDDECLCLFDLGSANGTFCNGARAKLGHHLEVQDEDVITLGGLHFKVRIIDHS